MSLGSPAFKKGPVVCQFIVAKSPPHHHDKEFDWIKPIRISISCCVQTVSIRSSPGRSTFETMPAARRNSVPGMKTIVVSRTLRLQDHPEVLMARIAAITDLEASPGKGMWLYGGG